MTNNTSSNNKNNSKSGTWTTEEICEANFMFPTVHFQSEAELNAMGEAEWEGFLIGVFEPIRNVLTDSDKKKIEQAIYSQKRLRLYHTTMCIVGKHIDISNEVGSRSDISDDNYKEEMKTTGKNVYTLKELEEQDAEYAGLETA